MACDGLRPQWPSSAFYVQKKSALVPSDRYVRSVNDPPLYGISTCDYCRDHQAMGWPTGTEYQYAFCSNYRPILRSCQQQPKVVPGCTDTSPVCPWFIPRGGEPIYPLYETTPLPVLDKHWRGAHYQPNDPLGVIKECETAQVHCRTFGHECLTPREKLDHVYTPNYRYKEWIQRPITEIEKDMNNDESLICRIPDTPKKFYDFYHEVRMNRPTQPVRNQELFDTCRVLPIPMNHEVPNLSPTEHNPHYGRFNNHCL